MGPLRIHRHLSQVALDLAHHQGTLFLRTGIGRPILYVALSVVTGRMAELFANLSKRYTTIVPAQIGGGAA